MAKMLPFPVTVGSTAVNASDSVRNLGIKFDTNLSMVRQVNAIRQSCFFQIRNIGRIRRFITPEATRILVQTLVLSRLDYGNALLYRIHENLLARVQRIQNAAARLILHIPPREHITPALVSLHWLPVHQRIQFKIMCLTYHCLNGSAPAYLQADVRPYTQERILRSSKKNLLQTPTTRLKTYGDCCFPVASARLWNILPDNIKASPSIARFKGLLKTFLFGLAYK
eukprot:GHVR01016250.1.p1 GENE.GHVR01016250.1~~GHVR01016250.1.p1  ORF type:complete len:226 (+),score=-8.28 GHVR01016250.1:195-872(+)